MQGAFMGDGGYNTRGPELSAESTRYRDRRCAANRITLDESNAPLAGFMEECLKCPGDYDCGPRRENMERLEVEAAAHIIRSAAGDAQNMILEIVRCGEMTYETILLEEHLRRK